MSLSAKQKASREKRIGSSDAATVAGVNPYKGPMELFYQLTGQLPRYSDEETRATKIGSLIQDPIGALAAEELGIKIRRAPPRVHPKHDFMSANLDFDIISNPKGPGFLEIKNRGASSPYEGLPEDIQLQIAHQMAVRRCDWGIVAILFGFGTLKTYEVERDKELEEYLIELEARFILRVEKNEPPTDAWTPETVDLLKKLYPQDSGKVVELPITIQENIFAYLRLKENIEDFISLKARHEGILKSAIGDASVATIPGFGEITWKKTKDGQTFDEEEFAKQHPALYALFQKPKLGHRVFLVKPQKENTLCLPKKSPSAKTSLSVPDLPTDLPDSSL